MDLCASGKTQGSKSMNCLWIITDPTEMEKINYCGMKVNGTKSFASQLHSPPPTVGKIQSSKLPSSSLSSSALTPRGLIFTDGPPAWERRMAFWPVEVNPKPKLSDLKGKSGSWPQMVDPPSSTISLTSLRDDIRGRGLVILGVEDTALVTAISGETSSKCWKRVYMNSPSNST